VTNLISICKCKNIFANEHFFSCNMIKRCKLWERRKKKPSHLLRSENEFFIIPKNKYMLSWILSLTNHKTKLLQNFFLSNLNIHIRVTYANNVLFYFYLQWGPILSSYQEQVFPTQSHSDHCQSRQRVAVPKITAQSTLHYRHLVNETKTETNLNWNAGSKTSWS